MVGLLKGTDDGVVIAVCVVVLIACVIFLV